MHGPIAATMRSALAPSALHRGDGGVGDAAERAFPAGMRRADDAGGRVGEQHRHAIGGEDAEQQAGPIGDERVGMRARIVGEGRGDGDGIGRMDLVQGDERRAGRDRRDRARAVLGDRGGIVVRAEADVEPGVDAGGDAALAGRGSRGGCRRGRRR